MDLNGTICVVTGGGGGIGAALATALTAAGAGHVVVSDKDGAAARAVAARIGGSAIPCDVGDAEAVAAMVARTECDHGRIDLVCSNAGILRSDPADGNVASLADDQWEKCWQVNVMAHIRLSRAALPGMISRGSGHFLYTVSAAGLLSIFGASSYAVTKHAALGFAETVALTHGDDGIGVSVLCPQAVDTAMARQGDDPNAAAMDGIISAEEVARVAVEGVAGDRFMILPHPEVLEYFRNKARDYDRWIGGMRKLRRRFITQTRTR